MNIVSPKYDIVFKSIFTDPNAPEILQGFIAEALGISYDSIKNIVIGNSEIYPESDDEKFSRLDLLADVDGKKVNIEIQCTRQYDYADRSLYYWAKTFGSQLKSGMNYEDLPNVICINIVDFNIFREHDDYASSFEIYDAAHNVKLTDKFKTIYYELPKALKKKESLGYTGIDAWIRFFNVKSEEELTMLERTTVNEPIKKAVVTLRKLSDDEIICEKIRREEKRRHDEASMLKTAKIEGREEGREEGRKQGREEGREEERSNMFVALVKNGFDPIDIANSLEMDITDFETELYTLETELADFSAEDYLNPSSEDDRHTNRYDEDEDEWEM